MITINLDKAKTIAHEKRRAARSAEFAPLDIKATIPSEAVKMMGRHQLGKELTDEQATSISTWLGSTSGE